MYVCMSTLTKIKKLYLGYNESFIIISVTIVHLNETSVLSYYTEFDYFFLYKLNYNIQVSYI